MKLSIQETDYQVVKKLKSSLLKSFNPRKQKDWDKAIILTSYLFALEQFSDLEVFLDIFVYKYIFTDIDFDPDLVSAAVMLATISSEKQDEKYASLIKYIIANEVEDLDESFYEKFLYYQGAYDGSIKYGLANGDKPEELLREAGSYLLIFLYFPLMYDKLEGTGISQSQIIEFDKK